MADTAVDFLLEDLKHILSYSSINFIIAEKDQIESLIMDLEFIRAFLDDSEEKCNANDQLNLLVAHIQDVAWKTLDDLDSFVCGVLMQKDEILAGQVVGVFHHSSTLESFEKEIQFIKTKVKEIYDCKLYGIGVQEQVIPSSENLRRSSSPILGEKEIVVGFDNEIITIKERLVALKQQLEVISIVGMAGLGKTTLASKIYNDPLIVHHFDLRAWICVSQVYQKRDLLFDVLNYIVENKDDLYKMKDERLAEELYKRLKGHRYLIVVDDIWNNGAWEDLRRSFPDDKTGSRIMLTTRVNEVALNISCSTPHYLRFLSKDESWDLLKKKAFPNENCPLELRRIGKKIAAKCQGLPLAITVVGGLLAKEEKKKPWWEQVSDRVSSYITGDPEKKYMDILVLSYNHLPCHLKKCFRYFGAFPEDTEIYVRWLIRSWIAEGFVKQMGERRLEEIAEEYLMDLVDRSLVLISKKRSKGGIKVCRIHDMLRDLCLRQGNKMNFLQFKQSETLVHNSLCFHSHGYHYGISGNVCDAHVGPLPLFAHVYMKGMLISTHIKSFVYKLLKVLDLGFINLSGFPDEILHLIHLRYLKLHVDSLDKLLPQIQNLWNLETLVIIIDHQRFGCRVTIPANMWEMVKLRHLRISGKLEFEKPCFNYVLDNLQSLSALPLSHSTEDSEFILKRTPNLRKLTFHNSLITLEKISIPDLSNLTHLETLKLIDDDSVAELASIPPPSKFPPSLKKLTLRGGYLDWEEISNLGKLPNLEVLKLGDSFFSGTTWKTNEGEFDRLKYLELSWMDLQLWITSSSSHFPSLQHLVLDRCMYLEEIPSCIGDVPTLDMIEVSWSSRSAMESARTIQEEQMELGNDGLQVVLVYERFGMVRSKSTYNLQALME